jgi:hypothetical protein
MEVTVCTDKCKISHFDAINLHHPYAKNYRMHERAAIQSGISTGILFAERGEVPAAAGCSYRDGWITNPQGSTICVKFICWACLICMVQQTMGSGNAASSAMGLMPSRANATKRLSFFLFLIIEFFFQTIVSS